MKNLKTSSNVLSSKTNGKTRVTKYNWVSVENTEYSVKFVVENITLIETLHGNDSDTKFLTVRMPFGGEDLKNLGFPQARLLGQALLGTLDVHINNVILNPVLDEVEILIS